MLKTLKSWYLKQQNLDENITMIEVFFKTFNLHECTTYSQNVSKASYSISIKKNSSR